ncbi:DUF3618 domain-containing protein [Microbacterium sp. zg-YB36]|uniref:DUF3618 domain-containing protein n=1 Tax=Microbacterium sp. zg-YB36 TaxID=2969407 RepID=UPI00214BDC17|nr:DUF3618 domain-containing protein [Microbacterium sp. zg-YB36]MDL5350681.1 DUF3618 domain-containing protein [Microbacterium sp. zg-YB36]
MSDSPEQIRADIEQTRAELGGDVDALADKVSPSKIVHRQTDKVRTAVGSVRERVMGAADDAGSSISGAGSSAIGQVGDAKDRVVAKAEGNPLAVGLIAFGAGLLVASLIPASEKEKQVAADVKEKAQPLVDEATQVAQDMGEHLKGPAQDAATAVKDAATDSAETVKAETQTATADVKDQAQQGREHLSGS